MTHNEQDYDLLSGWLIRSSGQAKQNVELVLDSLTPAEFAEAKSVYHSLHNPLILAGKQLVETRLAELAAKESAKDEGTRNKEQVQTSES